MMFEDVQHHARTCESMHECVRPCKQAQRHAWGGARAGKSMQEHARACKGV